MSEFAHIIAKRQANKWSAWFDDSPYILSEGVNVTDAITALMKIHALADLSTVQVVTVDGGTTLGRLDIRVPTSRH